MDTPEIWWWADFALASACRALRFIAGIFRTLSSWYSHGTLRLGWRMPPRMKSNLVSKRQFNGAENSSALVSPVTTVSRKDGQRPFGCEQ
jgi:hypothetical protein